LLQLEAIYATDSRQAVEYLAAMLHSGRQAVAALQGSAHFGAGRVTRRVPPQLGVGNVDIAGEILEQLEAGNLLR